MSKITILYDIICIYLRGLLLLVAFQDLWKEWGDSNFQIFFTELPVPPQAAGVVGTFNVLDIYPSEHYGLSFFGPYGCFFFTMSPFLYLFKNTFPFCKYTFHVCYVFNVKLTDSFDDRRSQCRLIE